MTLFRHSIPNAKAIAFAASCAISIVAGFVAFDAGQAQALLAASGYWFALGAVALFLIALARSHGPSLRCGLLRRDYQLAALLCVVGASFLYTREDPSFKVVMDEPKLAMTALSMHLDRQPLLIESSLGDSPQVKGIDKRPFLYPFLVSLAHDATGCRPENAFYANFAFTALLLFLFWILALRLSRSAGASYAATALLLASPLLAQSASGGGFDTLNCLLIVVAAYLATDVWEQPTEKRISTLALAAVLLAQTRYESALFAGAVAVVVAASCAPLRRWPIGWPAVAAPALLLPVAWQNIYIRATPEFWELEPGDSGPFGLQYLAENAAGAARFFFAPSADLASNPLLSVALAASLIGSFAVFVAQPRSMRQRMRGVAGPLSLVTVFVIGNFLLLMNYFWGQLDDPVASRLALPLIVIGALWFAPLAARATRSHSGRRRWLPPAIAALCVFGGIVSMSRLEVDNSRLKQNRFEWARAQLETELGERSLMISGFPAMWASYRIPAIHFGRAVANAERLALHFELGTYENVYVIQACHISIRGVGVESALNNGYDLGPAFKLETLEERSFYPYNSTRLSRLVAIDRSAIEKAGGWQSYINTYFVEQPDPVFRISASDAEAWKASLP